jgi:PilZ domain
MDDGRKAPRHRVLKAGTMSFGGAGITCTVRNLSDTGAALDVTSPIGIPGTFILVLESEHVQRSCRVVWRKARRIGGTFEG